MSIMDSLGDTPVESDAAPRKPTKSFLKRGEGVKRRIDAYKYRTALKPVGNAIKDDQFGPSDQSEQQDSSQHAQTYDEQLSYASCSNDAPTGFGSSVACLSDAARGKPATRASGGWAAPQTEEDTELEEFRALEREIWGGKQQNGQPQHQQPTFHESLSAAAAAPAALSPEAAEAAAVAAYGGSGSDIDDDNIDLGHGSSTRMVNFQDETEWVDTEFSFDGGMPQQPTRGAEQQTQQQLQQLRQQQHQQAGLSPAKLTTDAGTDGMLSQPYVRAIFAAKNGTGHMNGVSGANRSGRQQQRQLQQEETQGPAAHQDDSQPDVQNMQQQMVAVPAALVQKWQQWEAEQPRYQQDRADLHRMRHELEKAATRLEQERQAWEKQKAAAQASLEAWRSEEARRLARERRVLDQQSKALLKLPSKKEKSALDALEQQMEKERSEAKAAAARHRLTVERLRCQIKEAQDRNTELHEEVRWHETQQLNATAFAAVDARSRKKPPSSTVYTQTDGCLAQELPLATAAALAASAAAARLEAGGQFMQQAPAAAAAVKMSDPLYAALFGDDEGDFAAVEEAAAAAAPSSPASGKHMAYQQNHNAGHRPVVKSAAAAAAAATSNGTHGSSRCQQQVDNATPAPQLGRKVGNGVTLKPGVTWAASPQKQLLQQKHQQHAQQPQQLQQPGNSSNGSHWQATGQGEQYSINEFSFPAVAAQHTAHGSICSGGSFQQQHQQQWQHQQQQNTHQSSSSPGYDPYVPGDQHYQTHTNYNSDRHDSQQQQQHHVQQQQRLTTAGNSQHTTASQPAAAAVSATAGYTNGISTQCSAASTAVVGRRLVQELQHADGKLEQWLSDGSRVLHFANGTVKTTGCDGSVCIRFTNGDVKRQSADGSVDYYYAEVATWQSTHPCGIEVFYFPTGQVEGHHADGVMDIIFPDRAIKRVTPDGSEQDITAGLLPAAVQLPPPELDRF